MKLTAEEEIAFQNGLLCGMAAKGGIAVPVVSGETGRSLAGAYKITDMGYGGLLSAVKCVKTEVLVFEMDKKGAVITEVKLPVQGKMGSQAYIFERVDTE